jgi:hypothetical protein
LPVLSSHCPQSSSFYAVFYCIPLFLYSNMMFPADHVYVGSYSHMMFVFCLLFTKFPKYLRPKLASCLLMSLTPPISITVSLYPSVLTSLSAKLVIFASLAPDITVPVTSKSFPRPLDISTA